MTTNQRNRTPQERIEEKFEEMWASLPHDSKHPNLNEGIGAETIELIKELSRNFFLGGAQAAVREISRDIVHAMVGEMAAELRPDGPR